MRAALVALVVAAAGGPAHAQAPSFEGTGQAPVQAGDRVKARARALDEALRQAIEQAAATLLDPAALAQRQSQLKLTITPRARSYVASYRVLEEGEAGGAFRVRVLCELALDRLEHDLGGGAAGPRAPGPPRIGLCLVEPAALESPAPAPGSDDPAAAPRAWREAIRASLVAAGAAPAELPRACAALRGAGDVTAPDAMGIATAIKAAGLQGALVVQASGQPVGPLRGTALTGAQLHLRADLIDEGGATQWGIDRRHDGFGAGPAGALDATLRAALVADLGPLADAVGRRWPRARGLKVVVVAGWDRYADLVALERALAGAPGVSAVEARRFAGGSVELFVAGPSDPAGLVGALQRPPATPGAARYLARVRDAATVEVQLLAPPAPPADAGLDPAPPTSLPSLPPEVR